MEQKKRIITSKPNPEANLASFGTRSSRNEEDQSATQGSLCSNILDSLDGEAEAEGFSAGEQKYTTSVCNQIFCQSKIPEKPCLRRLNPKPASKRERESRVKPARGTTKDNSDGQDNTVELYFVLDQKRVHKTIVKRAETSSTVSATPENQSYFNLPNKSTLAIQPLI
jgi:hypothetical protein